METIFKQFVRRLAFLILTLMGTLLFIALVLLTYEGGVDKEEYIENERLFAEWDAQKLVLDNPMLPDLVRDGYYIVSESANYIGPNAKEPEQQYAGNTLSCTNCHLNGGTLSGSASWIGILDRFPQFRGRENRIGTIEDRINGCLERSMNGIPLPVPSYPMKAIVAYMDWISSEIPQVNSKIISGYPDIILPEVAVDLDLGKQIYTRECLLCHGSDGAGIRFQEKEKGYQYPPLWGEDSYNTGAGMHRVLTAAAFIKNNMPYLQASWENPKLSDLEAFHVAGYINSFSRPQKQNTDADFPDKKLKPISTPYGPWTDDFSPEQHKYGPFPPIVAFYEKTFKLKKTK